MNYKIFLKFMIIQISNIANIFTIEKLFFEIWQVEQGSVKVTDIIFSFPNYRRKIKKCRNRTYGTNVQ